jgi:hypothetical protein
LKSWIALPLLWLAAAAVVSEVVAAAVVLSVAAVALVVVFVENLVFSFQTLLLQLLEQFHQHNRQQCLAKFFLKFACHPLCRLPRQKFQFQWAQFCPKIWVLGNQHFPKRQICLIIMIPNLRHRNMSFKNFLTFIFQI